MRIMITIGVDGQIIEAAYQELQPTTKVDNWGVYHRMEYQTVRKLRHEQRPDGTIKLFLVEPEANK